MDDESQVHYTKAHIGAMEDIAAYLECISDRLGVIANALLQLSDKHGSKTPGPF